MRVKVCFRAATTFAPQVRFHLMRYLVSFIEKFCLVMKICVQGVTRNQSWCLWGGGGQSQMILSFSLESKVSNLNYYEKRSLITTIILSLYDTSYKSLIQYCIQGQSTKKSGKKGLGKQELLFWRLGI